MKIFTGCIATETNTFAPFATGLETFQEVLFLRRGEAVEQTSGMDLCRVFIENARDLGWEVVAGLRTFAQPAGRVPTSVYAALRDELLDDLRTSLPVNAVLLGLHGAMVAEDEDDCEGDLLERIRAIVGPSVPIGVHHDPHAHLTFKMIENADVIRIWREYPHTDIADCANEVFGFIKARLEGATRPLPVLYDCRMAQIFHTAREPMRSFIDKVREREGKDGIHSIAVAHSFPWGDVPEMGTKVLVYAEDEAALPTAAHLAETLGVELWNMREEIGPETLTLDEALDQKHQSNAAPIVVADGSDNPGGGAPCDSTFFLSRLLERGDSDWTVGAIYDPQALRIAFEAGIGAKLRLRVGGKVCELSGPPVDVDCTVTGLVRDVRQKLGELEIASGDVCSIDIGLNRHIVINNVRTQTVSPIMFEIVGVSLPDKRLVVVKSSQHFRAAFAPISSGIVYSSAPGVVTANWKSLPYRYADTTKWPFRHHAEAKSPH